MCDMYFPLSYMYLHYYLHYISLFTVTRYTFRIQIVVLKYEKYWIKTQCFDVTYFNKIAMRIKRVRILLKT